MGTNWSLLLLIRMAGSSHRRSATPQYELDASEFFTIILETSVSSMTQVYKTRDLPFTHLIMIFVVCYITHCPKLQRLPDTFMTMLHGHRPKNVKLRQDSRELRRLWDVELVIKEGHMYLCHGWEKFYRAYDLRLGYFLLFRYDDDAMIEPASLEVTYSFLSVLKEEYQDYTLAGSIIQLNKPYLQYEEGAQWNQGAIEALKHKVDLREVKVLLLNEDESEKVEYAGWWYCCIPLSVISKENLPLPLFIHRDDVEYGLRTGKGFIYLNGVGVWHEAFENKVSGPLEYYDIRNHCIVNAVHCPDYGAKKMKRLLLKWASSNIAKYRYKYADLNLRGVEDFLKGADWFMRQEPVELHAEICKLNYQAKPKEEYIGYKGITEEDYDWEKLITPDKSDFIPVWKKLCHLIFINGYILPAKKGKVPVVPPYNNIYKMFRLSETIMTDAAGNSVSTKRSFKRMVQCYRNLFKVMRRMDKEYEAAKKSYQERYREMANLDFWRKYLEL